MYSALLFSVIATLQLHNVIITQAFITEHHRHRSSRSEVSAVTPLLAASNIDDFFPTDDSDKNRFDVEALRQRFESLASNTGPSIYSSAMQEQPNLAEKEPLSSPVLLLTATDSSVPLRETPALDVAIEPRPPLTSIERERRSAEIELLGHLTYGEEAVKEIYNLWFAERGAAASKLLHQSRELMEQGPKEQDEAEAILLALIDDYGVYFTEPLNQLAILYHVQGRYEKALQLNKIVLSIKPWHFGALSHIVMVYAAMGDQMSARQWAYFRLPTFSNGGSNQRRSRWVERAVVEATVRLHQGEKNNAKSFGISDREWIAKQGNKFNKFESNDANSWQ
ncbi:unnamed protein product [Cylindrotheca closterium]|uniref:ER membrane protein complex subunit 2 n=1 Tax=Cylindrotheca closterium TaxID=2856 RepID=A0AAD2FVV8_9STRA|nr:unnamed protein product [Cylindrotheca closterium]